MAVSLVSAQDAKALQGRASKQSAQRRLANGCQRRSLLALFLITENLVGFPKRLELLGSSRVAWILIWVHLRI